MAASKATEAEFVAAWQQSGGSPTVAARLLGLHIRNVYSRRDYLESKGYELPSHNPNTEAGERSAYRRRIEFNVDNGCIFVGGDRHIWPGDGPSIADLAMRTLAPRLRPVAIISNGDVFDGARLTRHDPLGHEQKPRTDDEIRAVQEHLDGLAGAVTAWDCRLMRTVGNHDMRFDRHLAKWAGDMSGLVGFRLRDHLPRWDEAWAIHINRATPAGYTVVKHRQAGGVHAAYNNTLKGGCTLVTGHTHRQDVRPLTDYNGTRWGVQAGMMASLHHPAHEYAEDAPDPGQPGFAILTWLDGVLLPPELVTVDAAGVAWWRGEPVTLRVRVKAGSAVA